MLSSFKKIKNGLTEVLFPHVCLVCGISLSKNEQFICPNCIVDRFEIANPEGKQVSGDTLIPEGVVLQHALWNFDKGGFLQDLLHSLKYQRLTGVGIDLGIALGNSLKRNPFFEGLENSILIPVPLHHKKRRIRGYNQAYLIAKGVRAALKVPICKRMDVVRTKNTKTQTGFTLDKRRENIQNAFVVNNPFKINSKLCIIVDDVFTTGATAFELSNMLLDAGADKIMIITVAQA